MEQRIVNGRPKGIRSYNYLERIQYLNFIIESNWTLIWDEYY